MRKDQKRYRRNFNARLRPSRINLEPDGYAFVRNEYHVGTKTQAVTNRGWSVPNHLRG